ncbi:MAG: hypothetical protein WC238_01090 [Parcubacteria group bacterium]
MSVINQASEKNQDAAEAEVVKSLSAPANNEQSSGTVEETAVLKSLSAPVKNDPAQSAKKNEEDVLKALSSPAK